MMILIKRGRKFPVLDDYKFLNFFLLDQDFVGKKIQRYLKEFEKNIFVSL